MKKVLTLLLISVSVFAISTGCSKPAEVPAAEPAPVEAPSAPAPEAPVSDEVTDKDGILKLMGGGQDVMEKGISYDNVMTIGEIVTTSRFSYKGDNVRMEALDPTNPTLMITKGRELFIINPKEKTGFKMTTEVDAGTNPTGDVKPEENMDKDSLNIVGKEDLNGEPCYIVSTKNIIDGYDMKMWIHRKYGIMMKMESQTPEGKMLLEVKNLKVGNIPDSDFEIPADIVISEMPGLPQ